MRVQDSMYNIGYRIQDSMLGKLEGEGERGKGQRRARYIDGVMEATDKNVDDFWEIVQDKKRYGL